MFGFIKKKLQKIYESVTSKLYGIFSQKTINAETLEELKRLLITSDTGVTATKKIISRLQEQYKAGEIEEGHQLQKALETQLLSMLSTTKSKNSNPSKN